MAKYPRIFQRIFGSNAPVDQMGIIGSLAAGEPATSLNLDDIQNTSNFLDGLQSIVVGDNSPAIEDFNSLFFLIFSQLAYQLQTGIPEWNALTQYYTGNVVNSGGILYISRTDSNSNNAVTDNANWAPYDGLIRQTTANDPITIADRMIECDATIASYTETLPAANTCRGQRFTITKMDNTANTILVTDGTYSRYLVGRYDSVTVFSNGSIFYEIA